MEELKIKAIVLNSIDYKEKDKLVTLFSLELGLISVVLKNCKSSVYKLKFAYSTFSFAEFEIIKNGEMFFVKNAYLIDNFFELSSDYDKFILAENIIEILLKCNTQLNPNQILFINTLKVLNLLCYDEINIYLLLIKFLLGTLKVNGFKLNFNYCYNCELEYVNKIYLNLEMGVFECGSCKSNYSVFVEKEVFNLLKKLNLTDLNDIKNLENSGLEMNDKTIKDAIKLLTLNIENRFNIRLNLKNYYK